MLKKQTSIQYISKEIIRINQTANKLAYNAREKGNNYVVANDAIRSLFIYVGDNYQAWYKEKNTHIQLEKWFNADWIEKTTQDAINKVCKEQDLPAFATSIKLKR